MTYQMGTPYPYLTMAGGIALRDHFAGLALTVLLKKIETAEDCKDAITASYAVADAMLKERAK